jgi:hypothetical protein
MFTQLRSGASFRDITYFGNGLEHRVVTAAFWRTFHHEGKISLGW